MLQTYQCHKEVRAAKIVNIQSFMGTHAELGRTVLHLQGGGFITKPLEWYKKHLPACGGYYVEYGDGYASYSPAKAFEEGYFELGGVRQIDSIARICHEVNRAYCQSQGDTSQPSWEEAPEWQRVSARMGVDLHLSGEFGPEATHINWMNHKIVEGWKYGPVKDPVKKEHPCMMHFANLPREQQTKDYLFRAVVHAFK